MTNRDRFVGKDRISSWSADRLDVYVREYGTVLQRYFARRGEPPDICEELSQTVFLRLAALTKTGEIDNGEAYLMQTASSVWLDFLRKKQRISPHLHDEYDDLQHSPEGFSAERVLEGRQALDCVIQALEELPKRTRQIYLLCRIDGESRKKVASRYGISISAVDKHLMNASKHIGLAIRKED